MSLYDYKYGAPGAARPDYNSQAARQTRTSVAILSKLIAIASAMARSLLMSCGT